MSERAKKILIVDDEPDMVVYLSAWLEDHGFDTCSASDGAQGIQLLRQEAPDLILLDLNMPTETGVQLYRKMLSDDSLCEIPVIFVTGITKFELFSDDCTPLPRPAAVLGKPIEPEALLEAVQTALA